MNQQRARRFRSAQEAKEKDEEKEAFMKMLRSQNNGNLTDLEETNAQKKTWDSNAITPGTPFMDTLAASLRYWVTYKLNNDPAWAELKIIISDATVPGEGEHKIMQFIRSQRSSQEHDPNTRHVLYGLDADLIMLGLATHEPHFRVLREDVFFQQGKGRNCHRCGQPGHIAADCQGEARKKQGEFDEKSLTPSLKPFIWLHVSTLREYLAIEMHPPHQPFKFDLERAIDDWVFMCFFVGNDFLPHLPSLDIREEGIDILIAIWRDNLPAMGGYVTKDGHVDLERLQYILSGLAKQENAIFKNRREVELRKERNAKRRKMEEAERNGGYNAMPNGKFARDWAPNASEVDLITLGNPSTPSRSASGLTHEMIVKGASQAQDANQANKSAAAVLKERLAGRNAAGSNMSSPANGSPNSVSTMTPPSTLGKRKASELDTASKDSSNPNSDKPDPDEAAAGDVRLWEEGYGDRYYESKFHVDPSDHDFRHKVARHYVEGLCWVLLYYFQGCPSWNWFYPHHYAPFAADFVNIADMDITFDKGKPFRPFEQLMGVLPAASNHAIPEVFHPLMTDDESDIKDFYPEDFAIDLNGKKMAWQAVILLPFIDEARLLKSMNTKYPLLSDDERRRNETGRDALFFSESHPLFEPVTSAFYGKKLGAPKINLDPRISLGLSGKVQKNDECIPFGAVPFPGGGDEMPDIDDDRSINVYYDLPLSSNIHKSMLLRGVEFPPQILEQDDIEGTRMRALKSGRSFGGAPMRDPSGHHRGRGGRINYADRGGRGGGGGGGGWNVGPNGRGSHTHSAHAKPTTNSVRDNQGNYNGNHHHHHQQHHHFRDSHTDNTPQDYNTGSPLESRPNPFADLLDPNFLAASHHKPGGFPPPAAALSGPPGRPPPPAHHAYGHAPPPPQPYPHASNKWPPPPAPQQQPPAHAGGHWGPPPPMPPMPPMPQQAHNGWSQGASGYGGASAGGYGPSDGGYGPSAGGGGAGYAPPPPTGAYGQQGAYGGYEGYRGMYDQGRGGGGGFRGGGRGGRGRASGGGGGVHW